jgi:hypothetical protein
MTLINVFAFSASIMTLMLMFRAFEIKIGRDIIPKNFREALDELIIDICKISILWFKKKKKKWMHELKKVPIFILHMFIGFWGFALRKTLKAVSFIQGKTDGVAKRYVAEHLESVDAYQEHLKKKEKE